MSDSFAVAQTGSSGEEWRHQEFHPGFAESIPRYFITTSGTNLRNAWATWIENELAASRVPIITTHSLGTLVASALLADEAHRTVETVRSNWAAHDLTRRLLWSSEEYTGLPLITALVDDSVFNDPALPARLRAWALASLAELDQAAKEIARVRKALRDILRALLGGCRYAFDDHPPPHASSPCGVIRFAAPLVPRAPGSAAASPAPSSICVLAA
ncbi:hypothetical protein ACQ86D_27600 [Streptomyces galilaeus]